MISTYSVRIFRNLVNRWSLKSIPKNVTIRTTDLRRCYQTKTSNVKTYIIPNREENVRKVVRLMEGYQSSKSIEWGKLEEQINQLDLGEPGIAIIQACLRLGDLEAGISYFNHVTENGKDFTAVELIFFLKLFSSQKGSVIKYETTVKHVFDKIKVYLSSEVIQNYLLQMISEIPDYFYPLVKNICEKKYTFQTDQLVNKAFELKNTEIAFELMNTFNININFVFNSYINYLCHMVMENKFSVDMITTLLKYSEDNNNFISSNNYLSFSITFFETLKKYEKNYKWSLNNCDISESSICSNCGKKLIDKCISQSDFNSLKKAFFPKAGMTEKHAFLSSSDTELNKFFKFLNNSKPYQIVVDALNLMYRNKRTSTVMSRPIKHFLDKQMDVLIIGRRHVRNQILRMSFLKKKEYKNRCQFFFTENLSDDDLFTLYAALHRGLGTYIISGDFLQSYGARFDSSLKRIYLKWKAYHQFVYDTDIISPLPSLGLSQLTSDENGEKFTWHISNISGNYKNDLLNRPRHLKWACLQAEKKSS